MYYKVSATIEARLIIDARNEEEAREKAQPLLYQKLRDPVTIKSAHPCIKVEPFGFMNKKIIIPMGGPLSGEY